MAICNSRDSLLFPTLSSLSAASAPEPVSTAASWSFERVKGQDFKGGSCVTLGSRRTMHGPGSALLSAQDGAAPAGGGVPRSPGGTRRGRGLAGTAAAALGTAAAALLAGSVLWRAAPGRTALTGVIGNDAGMSSRWEGSNAKFGMPSYSNDAMNAKEEETGFGVAGQLGTGDAARGRARVRVRERVRVDARACPRARSRARPRVCPC